MIQKKSAIHKFMTATFIVAVLFVSACSNLHPQRNIASDEMIDKLLTFKRSAAPTLSPAEAQELFKRVDNNTYDIKRHAPNMKIEFVKTQDLGPDNVFKISAEVDANNNYKVKILHTQDAFSDGPAVIEMYKFFDDIFVQKVESSFSIMEMIINAKAEEPVALHAMAKLRLLAIDHNIDPQTAFIFKLNPKDFIAHSDANISQWRTMVDNLASDVKKDRTVRIKIGKQRKELLAKLDTLPEEKQFRHLVSIGDRKGAADLIEAYLPWEDMLYFEKEFWKTQIDIIRNPLPLDKRVMIYRGLQDDVIQTPVIAGKKMELTTAKKEQNIFVMSTLLAKNQGSWNRRLRSLQTINDKFMGKAAITDDNEYTKAARISTFFKNHSTQPVGSPFLSFTPSIDTAITFGKQKVSAYLIDPRLLSFNYASRHTQEHEYLAPLATFPDEIYAYYDTEILPQIDNQKKADWMKNQIMQKLMREQGDAQGFDTYMKVTANTKTFFNHYGVKDPELDATYAKHAEALAKLPNMGPTKPTDASCKNILKNFWK